MSINYAQRLMDLFKGHSGAHGTHGTPEQEPGGLKWGIKTTAKTLREPVTIELWEKHLKGERPLGVVPIMEDGNCMWGSIDVDRYDIDLFTIVAAVEEVKLPLVPGRSKSGGLHLYLFLTSPVSASEVQFVLRNLAASLGLSGCEIFPKQTQVLTERGDIGNWMVMPYFGGTYGGKIKEQVGLKRSGAEMELIEFLHLAEERRASPEDFKALRKKRAHTTEDKADFSDGPPCLQYLAVVGVPEGNRNNTLFHAGVYFQKAYSSNWKQKIEEYNHKFFKPPLSAEEIMSCIRSLEKRTYNYTCKNEPMVSHCDSVLCRVRKYGVGEFSSLPQISGVSMLSSEPPIWFVDVEGVRLELSTEDFMEYRKFQKVCMEVLQRLYPVMSQAAWNELMQAPMLNVNKIDAAPDIGMSGQFREWLEEFLTNRRRGDRREDLLRGVPYMDEDLQRYEFRLQDLMAFLKREGETKATRTRVSLRIRAMGGDRDAMKINGRHTNFWWIPAGTIEPLVEVEPAKAKVGAI